MPYRAYLCWDGGPFVRGNESCPNVDQHTPYPVGYVSNSSAWADDALVVADQKRCEGCGELVVWVPKRPDLRVVPDWPPGSCDWGSCDEEGVAERFHPESHKWLPVCRKHTGIQARRPSPDRADCPDCGKPNVALTTAGTLRAHNRKFAVRCPASGQKSGEVRR